LLLFQFLHKLLVSLTFKYHSFLPFIVNFLKLIILNVLLIRLLNNLISLYVININFSYYCNIIGPKNSTCWKLFVSGHRFLIDINSRSTYRWSKTRLVFENISYFQIFILKNSLFLISTFENKIRLCLYNS